MRSIVLLLVVSAAAFGQRTGAGNNTGFNTNSYARPNTFGSITGFGNVVFPGTGHAPIANHPLPLTTLGGGVGVRGGRIGAGGVGGGVGVVGGGRRFRGANNSVVFVPYGVGGFGGYYGGDPGGFYPQQEGFYPQEGYYPQQQGYAQPQGVPPMVVINQNFVPETAHPIVREYSSDPNGRIQVYPPTSSAPVESAAIEIPTYLIAFKDHTIYAAVAYWVEGNTLHYVTNQNTHNQVSFDLVDRELSERLNRERNVDFRLSPAK